MLDVLRDPAWQFVGVVLAIVSVAVAIWIFLLQKQVKELAFGVVSSRRLLSIADELTSRVTVQLDGQSVQNLHLVVFALKNSGHRAVTPEDFQRPLSISFVDGQVVSSEIATQSPHNLQAQLQASESSVILNPLLMNPTDQLQIQALVSAVTPSFTVDARIVDVSKLAPLNLRQPSIPYFQSALFTATLLFAGIGAALYFIRAEPSGAQVFLGVAFFMPVFAFVMRLSEIFGRSARRRINEA